MRITIIVVLCCMSFLMGYICHSPNVKTQEKIVYSLPEGVSLNEICGNVFKQTVEKIRQEEAEKFSIWQQGYNAGKNK